MDADQIESCGMGAGGEGLEVAKEGCDLHVLRRTEYKSWVRVGAVTAV